MNEKRSDQDRGSVERDTYTYSYMYAVGSKNLERKSVEVD